MRFGGCGHVIPGFDSIGDGTAGRDSVVIPDISRLPGFLACRLFQLGFDTLEVGEGAAGGAVWLNSAGSKGDLHGEIAFEIDIPGRLQHAMPIDNALARSLAVDVGAMDVIEMRSHFVDVVGRDFVAV